MSIHEIERTRLWNDTLAARKGDRHAGAREYLRSSFVGLRSRAAILANEIARDLPEFTVHDETHLDAVWQTADLIAGEGYPINPAEAFVLGAAIMLHDLGMGLAAYTGGLGEIRATMAWKDAFALFLRNSVNPAEQQADFAAAGPEAERFATKQALRLLHADKADHLAEACWLDRTSGTEFHLLEAPELRGSLGPLIGRIAASHWWPVDRVKRNLSVILNPPEPCPTAWSVDILKVACLVRCADVAQVDERRAPAFLTAVRKPSGQSSPHWIFQSKLQRPREDGGRLVYTSGASFSLAEADAWWLCLDTLRLVDKELRDSDALLADAAKPRFRARSVAAVDDPGRLRDYIPTDGWTPIDARVGVSDVPALVNRIGGEELYGRDPSVPLRELIQNASDAVRARRLHEALGDTWGRVSVRLGADRDGTPWLEVSDTGIGMSHEVLAGPLLDFGTSYWGTELMRQELPGLTAKNFRSTGKFGIGFFSVFMWGSRVKVTTRRPEEARNATRVLEFVGGLAHRPIIRPADHSEMLNDGGTAVRVWLKNDPTSRYGLLYRKHNNGWTLRELSAYLAPCLDVDLEVEDGGRWHRVVTANDWMSMDARAFLLRVTRPEYEYEEAEARRVIASAAPALREIQDADGVCVARACVARGERFIGGNAAVVVGGLRAGEVWGCCGAFVGNVVRAARDGATPIASRAQLREWATIQERLSAAALRRSPDKAEQAAMVCAALNAPCEKLPVAYARSGWLKRRDIARLASRYSELILVDTDDVWPYGMRRGINVKLLPNVIVTSLGVWSLITSRKVDDEWPEALQSLRDVVLETVADAWCCTVEELEDSALRPSRDEDDSETLIGHIGTQPLHEIADVIRKPRKVIVKRGRKSSSR